MRGVQNIQRGLDADGLLQQWHLRLRGGRATRQPARPATIDNRAGRPALRVGHRVGCLCLAWGQNAAHRCGVSRRLGARRGRPLAQDIHQGLQIDTGETVPLMQQAQMLELVAGIALRLGAKAQGNADVFLGNGKEAI